VALLIATHRAIYPKARRGRPADWLGTMRAHLFPSAVVHTGRRSAGRDALYDSQAMQKSPASTLCSEDVPDATTVLKFRRLLETNDLQKAHIGQG